MCFLGLTACQLPYLAKGAYEQIKILNSRKSVKKVVTNDKLEEHTKEKLLFALKAHSYGETKGLTCKENFKSYVELNRDYVSYLLIASKKDKLEAKMWRFPIVGSFPYKGFFSEEKALSEAEKLIKKNYDTFVRGVPAYSSLGWFKEPILSSMLHGTKYNLAETIFHECFHSTVFYKNEVDKNEQLATFFAHHIMIAFLKDLELTSEIDNLRKSWSDQLLFSLFLKENIEIAELNFSKNEDQKNILDQIKQNYLKNLKPKLQILNFDKVFLKNLNNAKLVAFKTYFFNFDELEHKLQNTHNNDIFNYLISLK